MTKNICLQCESLLNRITLAFTKYSQIYLNIILYYISTENVFGRTLCSAPATQSDSSWFLKALHALGPLLCSPSHLEPHYWRDVAVIPITLLITPHLTWPAITCISLSSLPFMRGNCAQSHYNSFELSWIPVQGVSAEIPAGSCLSRCGFRFERVKCYINEACSQFLQCIVHWIFE